MKFKLEIDLDNSAFEIDPEQTAICARSLADVIEQMTGRFKDQEVFYDAAVNDLGGKLRDFNGNTCGHWQITEEN